MSEDLICRGLRFLVPRMQKPNCDFFQDIMTIKKLFFTQIALRYLKLKINNFWEGSEFWK